MSTHPFRTGLICIVLAIPLSGFCQVFSFTTIAGQPGNLGTTDGTNSGAQFLSPAGVCLGPAGIVYVADGNAIRSVRAFGTNWVVTTLAGSAAHGGADGTNSAAQFDFPQGVAVDSAGSLFIADANNNAIRRLMPSGTNWVATTLAGAGRSYPGSVDGTNTSAKFNHPYGVAVGAGGTLYVADANNSTIRKITPAGTNWITTTIAGSAGQIGGTDGTNNNARFGAPDAIILDSATNLYVADNNNTIRKLKPSGTNWVVSTIAGTAAAAGSADGTNGAARFNGPAGVTLDSSGNLYVTDSGNNTIRKIKPSGTNWVVSTIAGTPGVMPENVDGTGSAARFSQPEGIAVDSNGRLFVADDANYTMRLGVIASVVVIANSGTQINVSWPVAFSNYVLETSGTVAPGATWHPITNGFGTSGDFYLFPTNNSSAAAFYRLHKP